MTFPKWIYLLFLDASGFLVRLVLIEHVSRLEPHVGRY